MHRYYKQNRLQNSQNNVELSKINFFFNILKSVYFLCKKYKHYNIMYNEIMRETLLKNMKNKWK